MNKQLSEKQISNIIEFLIILNMQEQQWIIDGDKEASLIIANNCRTGWLELLTGDIDVDKFLKKYVHCSEEKGLFSKILCIEPITK